MTKKSNYTSDSIKSLSQYQHLLKRLNLTFGSEQGDEQEPYSSQKGVAVREILDNSIDEVMRGYGKRVKLTFFNDGSIQVQDSGRGLPVDVTIDEKKRKVSGIFKCLGVLQSGGKFVTDESSFSSGLNGVGASSTVFCSKRADVTVYRDNKIYQLSFKDSIPGFFKEAGNPDSEFTPLPEKDYSTLAITADDRPADLKALYPTGTTVRVWLRDEVFSSPYPVNRADLIERFKLTSFLIPELEAEVESEPDGLTALYSGGELDDLFELEQPSDLLVKGSLSSAAGYIERNVPTLQADGRITHEDTERRVEAEVKFGYSANGQKDNLLSFVNTIHTKDGGVHEQAFVKALYKVFQGKLANTRLLSKDDDTPRVDDFLNGLTSVISVKVVEPSFEDQTKRRLGGREVQKALLDLFERELTNWADSNKTATGNLLKRVAANVKVRSNAAKQRELNRKKNEINQAALPTKLLDCANPYSEESELYLCLRGDTKIRLENEIIITIKDLADLHRENAKLPDVIGLNAENKPISVPLIKAFETRKVHNLACLTLEDGSKVYCTPDHRFLQQGKWVKVEDLHIGDTLDCVKE